MLGGALDVAFMRSGTLEALSPGVADKFILIETNTAMVEGETFPFATSTPVAPSYGLAASPAVPWAVRKAVLAALMALNASHPAARGAGVATFVPAPSYEAVRQAAVDVGVVANPGPGATCGARWGGVYDLLQCPAGFVKDSARAVADGCARAGLPCPAGLVCLCRPCVPDVDVEMFALDHLTPAGGGNNR